MFSTDLRLRTAAGIVLIVIGMIAVPIPIPPGIPLIAAGAALLGPHHPLIRSSKVGSQKGDIEGKNQGGPLSLKLHLVGTTVGQPMGIALVSYLAAQPKGVTWMRLNGAGMSFTGDGSLIATKIDLLISPACAAMEGSAVLVRPPMVEEARKGNPT
jgi:hypothetical protein